MRFARARLTNLTNWSLGADHNSMKTGPAKAIYNLYEAKTALSKLVDQAARGEEIVIAKAGHPMAKLVPISAGQKKTKRNWDAGRDLFQVSRIAPDFDEPAWTDAELKGFGLL